MSPSLVRLARVLGTAAGTLVGIVALQLMRLRRMEFLPGHPGFFVNHVVGTPERGAAALRLVVLGDSTTAGVGVDRAEDSLPYLVAKRIARREGRAVHVVSYGWAGARAADLLADQLPRSLRPLRPSSTGPFLAGADIVLVVVGANDATHNTPPARYRSTMRAALERIGTEAPRAVIVLAGIPAFRGALPTIEPLILLTDLYARLLRPIGRAEAARAGALFADLAAEVPRRLRPGVDVLSSDRFHPSRAGYELWADVIDEALQRGTHVAGGRPSAIEGVGA